MEARIIQIGNSKGVRIPKKLITRYKFGEMVSLEETPSGLLIKRRDSRTLSWEDTYKAMAESDEDWSDWNDLDMGDVK